MAGYIGSKASVVSSGAERKKTFTITGATTSLTGLNYTVGKVHVFQNGVRLVDGTDYTATNGTTITLTAAAQSGDNVVVISQASYQVALSGIDDQSNAVAMTIDSNENVFIGKTSAGSATGVELAASGQVAVTRDGAVPAFFRRNTSDGSLIDFNKDGSTTGQINTRSGQLSIGVSDTGLEFNEANDNVLPCSLTANGGRDAAIDLGSAGARFKDTYLSGGVYLGGTTSTNKLTDYEEGTFTPSIYGNTSTGSFSGSNQFGHYTKIGNTVNIWFDCDGSISGASGSFMLGGLPFTSHSAVEAVGPLMFDNLNLSNNKNNIVFYLGGSSTTLQIFESADDASWTTTQISNEQVGIRGQLTYKV
jgi:hypothetical protein